MDIIEKIFISKFTFQQHAKEMSHALGKEGLMYVGKVSTQVSLRGLRRLTWAETFRQIDQVFYKLKDLSMMNKSEHATHIF